MTKDETGANEALLLSKCVHLYVCVCVRAREREGGKEGGCSGSALDIHTIHAIFSDCTSNVLGLRPMC